MKAQYTEKADALKSEYSEKAGAQLDEARAALAEIRAEVHRALELLERTHVMA